MAAIAAKKSNSAKLFGLGIKSKKAAASNKANKAAFLHGAAALRTSF